MLTQFFSENSRFYRFMMKLGDLIILNLLWLLTSLPIVTIGASTTALYSVMFRAAKNEESYLIRSYFRKFKENFRQATCIWLILLFLWILLGSDLYIMGLLKGTIDGTLSGVITGAVTLIVLLLALTTLYAFPMQARYCNTILQTIYKSFIFSIRFFGYTFQMLGVLLLPLGLTLMLGMLTDMWISWTVLFYLTAGVAATVYLMVKGPFHLLMKKLEPED